MMGFQTTGEDLRVQPIFGRSCLLQVAQLHAEKCELQKAERTYQSALKQAEVQGDRETFLDAAQGLICLEGETLGTGAPRKWNSILEGANDLGTGRSSARILYCKGILASYAKDYKGAKGYFLASLRDLRRTHPLRMDKRARVWLEIAGLTLEGGHYKRTGFLVQSLLKRYGRLELKGFSGALYLLKGRLLEMSRDFDGSLHWVQRAQEQYLSEHNWYGNLYVLQSYARLARLEGSESLAKRYLRTIEQVIGETGFKRIRGRVELEKKLLKKDQFDLSIDSRNGIVRTKEKKIIPLKKQFILLHLLETFFSAHVNRERETQGGLSKAEIVRSVWKEPYRSEIHDNKLYYNINRLRRLIEVDSKNPKYLLNWRNGYRLAPGLKVSQERRVEGGRGEEPTRADTITYLPTAIQSA